jgi:hypothetical protein
LAGLASQARSKNDGLQLFGNLRMFHQIAGTKRLHRMLIDGSDGIDIIATWKAEVEQFKQRRTSYLLYSD